jgi:hypothetical protein
LGWSKSSYVRTEDPTEWYPFENYTQFAFSALALKISKNKYNMVLEIIRHPEFRVAHIPQHSDIKKSYMHLPLLREEEDAVSDEMGEKHPFYHYNMLDILARQHAHPRTSEGVARKPVYSVNHVDFRQSWTALHHPLFRNDTVVLAPGNQYRCQSCVQIETAATKDPMIVRIQSIWEEDSSKNVYVRCLTFSRMTGTFEVIMIQREVVIAVHEITSSTPVSINMGSTTRGDHDLYCCRMAKSLEVSVQIRRLLLLLNSSLAGTQAGDMADTTRN